MASNGGGETTPLIGNSSGGGGGGGSGGGGTGGQNPSYYFLQRKESTNKGATDDGGEVVELPPEGANSSEFDSRPVASRGRPRKSTAKKGFFGGLFGFGKGNSLRSNQGKRIATSADILRQRQGAIKVEPKVFFANERTFLAWLHCSVLLAGASIAIMSFAETNVSGQLYGVILLPVAIAFMTYAMTQYAKRASMIRRRAPGPYEDITGPTALGIVLMLSIVAQFSIKLYQIIH